MNKMKKEMSITRIALIVASIIFGIWVSTYILLKDLGYEERGTLGDMFGTVNALFSGLALSGIILTILLQKKELGLQREELSETRKEFKAQNETLSNQRFENMFFALFNHMCEVTQTMKYQARVEGNSTAYLIEGKMVFTSLVDNLRSSLKEPYHSATAQETKVLSAFEQVFAISRETFQPYLGILYRLLTFVDNSQLDIISKYRYTKIIRGYMTDSELLFLRYYWSIPAGRHLKDLLEKYNILKHLPLTIRPEFDYQRKALQALKMKNSIDYGHIDLEELADKFDFLFVEAIFGQQKKVSVNMLGFSAIFMYVKREETTLTVKLKLPHKEYQSEFHNELFKERSESDLTKRLTYMNDLINFDFCGLIYDIVHARILTDNYKFILDSDQLKPYFSVSFSDSYDTTDGLQRVFECTFEFNNTLDNVIRFDVDDLQRIIERKSDESLKVRL